MTTNPLDDGTGLPYVHITDPNCADPSILWAEIAHLREAVKGPLGYSSWQKAAVAERHKRAQLEQALAARTSDYVRHADDARKKVQGMSFSGSIKTHTPAEPSTVPQAHEELLAAASESRDASQALLAAQAKTLNGKAIPIDPSWVEPFETALKAQERLYAAIDAARTVQTQEGK